MWQEPDINRLTGTFWTWYWILRRRVFTFPNSNWYWRNQQVTRKGKEI
jgi:hypothetical protein